MKLRVPASISDIVDVELVRGPRASADTPPQLLIEVPHGADEPEHYAALRSRLVGPLPEGLELFFNLNTDIGAWAYGRASAVEFVRHQPERAALVVRSLLPRTFVDCNRPADYAGGQLASGALTPGIPSYVTDPRDRKLLVELHARYVEVASAAFELVCAAGGRAITPHSYGPRTLGIDEIDADIVDTLRWACAPERHDSWPLRAEVDLLTRDGEGTLLASAALETELLARFAAAGYEAEANGTFHVHPSTLAHAWMSRYPDQVVGLEIRRDLLVEAWTPFEAMRVDPDKVARVAAILGPACQPQ